MRKFITATLICFLTMFSVVAAPTYGPPGAAIPAGADAAITVAALKLNREVDNTITATWGGVYNYDNKCTFVSIHTQPSLPVVGGGIVKGPKVSFAPVLPTTEKDVLPKAPIYTALATLPNLVPNTVVTVDSEINVTKPNPAGGVLTIRRTGTGNQPAPAQADDPVGPVVE